MTRLLTPEDVYAITLADDPRIAPDGSRVAFVKAEIDRESYEYRRSIWITPAEGGEARRFTAGPNDSDPRWSPDGKALAFVRAPAGEVKPESEEERDRGKGRPQIWTLPADGGEARQLTFRRHGASNPIWSPDGAAILFTAATGTPDDEESVDAALHGKRIPRVRSIERMWYRTDGRGFNYDLRTHLFTIPAAGGEPEQLTDGDWDDGQPAWSPDGTRIVFVSDRTDERWRWTAGQVWIKDLASGEATRITDEDLGAGSPTWSPDGAWLAFLGAPRRDSGGHTDLYVTPVNPEEGPARLLTQDFVPTAAATCIDDQRAGHGPLPLAWSADGRDIYFLASMRGTVHVYAAQPEGELLPRRVTDGDLHIYDFSLDEARRTLALAISDAVTPGDVYTAPVSGNSEGELRRLTNLNEKLLAEVELATPEEFTYRATDGWELQGWILRPTRAPASENVPAVLEIHGGPAAMYGYSFFMEFQLLAARGYAVVYVNPRGSTGYGRVFSSAVAEDWGGKDYSDVMAGLEAALAKGGIDADRLGVAGGSYGGYMTNWVVGHTDRFKAAVTMRSLANWASFFGISDIGPRFTVDQVGATPWENLGLLMEHSPITYAANIHTPLLILHSDNDLRCPIGEGEQMYAALKYLDRTVKLMRFEGQSHDLSRNGHPRSRVLRLRAIADWFDHYIPATVGANPHREAAEVAAPAHE